MHVRSIVRSLTPTKANNEHRTYKIILVLPKIKLRTLNFLFIGEMQAYTIYKKQFVCTDILLGATQFLLIFYYKAIVCTKEND